MKVVVVLAAGVLLAIGCGESSEHSKSPVVTNIGTVVANFSAPSEDALLDLYGTSVITGKVQFTGMPPKPVIIQMDADPYCKSMHPTSVTSQDVLINTNGTLRNVFVYVRGIRGPYTAPREPVVINQTGCLYQPRVQGIQIGQSLLIRNSDDTLHNIHALCEVNQPFNLGQPTRGMESKKVFSEPEVMVHFKCDVHPWMSGYLGVLPHPFFAVTGNDGTFMLPKLPPGEYVVEAWHEKFGWQQQKIAVGTNETKTIEFAFTN